MATRPGVIQTIKAFFGSDGYPTVTNEELKALTTKERGELAELFHAHAE